jgi:outer membrane protein assembly factor BamB
MWKGKRRRQGDYGQGQVLAVGDVILVQAEEGEVVMVDATSKELVELGRFPALTGQTWNNLCLYGKYLLVRNSEEAACFELALEELPPSVKPAAPNDD